MPTCSVTFQTYLESPKSLARQTLSDSESPARSPFHFNQRPGPLLSLVRRDLGDLDPCEHSSSPSFISIYCSHSHTISHPPEPITLINHSPPNHHHLTSPLFIPKAQALASFRPAPAPPTPPTANPNRKSVDTKAPLSRPPTAHPPTAPGAYAPPIFLPWTSARAPSPPPYF